MNSTKIIKDIANILHNSSDKYEAHEKLKNHIEHLSEDKKFIHDALKNCVNNKFFFKNATNLFFYLLVEGDVIIAINLFPPHSNKAKNLSHDNIHHHGWRLLTTAVISGDGYETISFIKKSHETRQGEKVLLKINEDYKHTKGGTKFVDSEQAHVVFHPESLSSTLAVWSADKILKNQKVKKFFNKFPTINKAISSSIHSVGLSELFGLNSTKGNYFHPEKGIIVETKNYSKPHDGSVDEILPCMFNFFQQIGFNDSEFFLKIKDFIPPNKTFLVDKLIADEPMQNFGISGDIRRNFSKTQILDALKSN